MKGRFVFTCGMAPEDFKSNAASVEELVTQRFGSMFAFQDLGGSVQIEPEYPESAEPMVADVEGDFVEFVEEVPAKPVSKSTAKRKAAQEANDK